MWNMVKVKIFFCFRWYKNKKVQKVVQDSKIMSRVRRTKIKLKDFKLSEEDEKEPGKLVIDISL